MRFKKILIMLTISFITLRAFATNNKINYGGYYIPTKEFRIGKFRLDDIAVAQAMDVLSYKSCKLLSKSYSATYASMMFEFSDVTSQKKVNSIGQDYYVNSLRVLPQTCQIMRNKLLFVGTDKQLGKISFVGTLDVNTLRIVQNKNISNKRSTVLRGDLIIKNKTFKNIEFEWFSGD